ncbi:MAG: hypothetical protein OEZ43_12540 [Gammaproteobacteria bacterium]|nr:hypothetical protein [Gammaproteobacteria bacterium]
MPSRLESVPVLAQSTALIDAARFNALRVAIKRNKKPLRMKLAGLRGLELELNDDVWLVVDATNNDLPVIAWLSFQLEARTDLTAPIRCDLRFYHAHAGVIVNKVLDIADEYVRSTQSTSDVEPGQKVSPIKRS